MDLIGSKPVFDITDRSWRIFSRSKDLPPQFVGDEAHIENAMISEGCEIYGTVENSILFGSVKVEKGARVRDSILFSDVTIGKNARIDYTIIDEGTVVKYGSRVGAGKETGKITVIGADLILKAKSAVEAGSMISSIESTGKGCE